MFKGNYQLFPGLLLRAGAGGLTGGGGRSGEGRLFDFDNATARVERSGGGGAKEDAQEEAARPRPRGGGGPGRR